MGLIWGILFLGWGDVLKPNQGFPESIGFYSNGCLSGADSLPLDGEGFQAMRPSRNRFYGHTSTLEFVQKLGKTLASMNSGILVGDLSQPRGGPMPSGHASHQIGLDVDVWFWTHPEQTVRTLSIEERETLPMISMLNASGEVDLRKFGEEQILKLKLAALSPGVQRIFVNPAIKKYLCSTVPDSESGWLHFLRPWKGHDAHFHVRLLCPKDSSQCTPQAPVPEGNGCDELSLSLTEFEMDFLEFGKEMPSHCESVLKDPTQKNPAGSTDAVQNLKNSESFLKSEIKK